MTLLSPNGLNIGAARRGAALDQTIDSWIDLFDQTAEDVAHVETLCCMRSQ
ncbi:MAG: hypothetical protein AAFR21_18715 [Pseudomonadota bacterium]